MRFFNTAGPVDYREHCYTPPLERQDMEDVLFAGSAMERCW